MDFVTNYKLEDYILNTQWEDLPQEIQQRAVNCAVDLFMALIVGSHGRQHQAGVRLAKQVCAPGNIPVVAAEPQTYNLLGATMVMGHTSNSFDIDDGHNMIKGHPGTSFVAGVLATALEQNVSYKEYLTTLVVCYEAAIRWALAMQDHYGYLHSTGAYGAFGTAAGAGRLMKLSREKLNNALSIADFHAPMTPVMRAVEYPSMNKDGVPQGALMGMIAVLETLAGSTGRTHLLEMPEYQNYLDTLGQRWEVTQLYFKPYTCCRWGHQPIQACIDLMKEYGFTYKDVEHVTVNTFTAAARLSKIVPHTTDEAQYNIAFPVASALVHGDVGFLQMREEALDDQRVLDTMKRLEFKVDPEMEVVFPTKRMAWVEIRLKDGRMLRSQVYEAPGEHTQNRSDQWFDEKFLRITAPFFYKEAQEKLLQCMRNTEQPIRTVVNEINRALAKL